MPIVVAAPDKFRGTASADEVTLAVERAAIEQGWTCVRRPMADGGEGTLSVLGGANRTTTVTGPLGDPVEARWRVSGRTAVIEMAEASGLALVGDDNDPVAASTYGTGELITAAVEAGATRIVVGVGGSATTDGGLGAIRALYPNRLRGLELIVACDVRTLFTDAAPRFGPQKGASDKQVELLRRRLERLIQVYRDEYGVDVSEMEGAGAAGGLAGGLAAIGARLMSGFELVSEECDLIADIERADLVVTGEGFVDEESFDGKVVGGIIDICAETGVDVFVIAGEFFDGIAGSFDGVSLVERYGDDRARNDTLACITEVVGERLARHVVPTAP